MQAWKVDVDDSFLFPHISNSLYTPLLSPAPTTHSQSHPLYSTETCSFAFKEKGLFILPLPLLPLLCTFQTSHTPGSYGTHKPQMT